MDHFGAFGVESVGGGVVDSGAFVVSEPVGAGAVEGVVDSFFGAVAFGSGFC